MATALQAGMNITVPVRNVTIRGISTIAWLEANPQTGELIGVGEDGAHQSLTEFGLAAGILAVGLGIEIPVLVFFGGVVDAQAAWSVLKPQYSALYGDAYIHELNAHPYYNAATLDLNAKHDALNDLRILVVNAIANVEEWASGNPLRSIASAAYKITLTALFFQYSDELRNNKFDPPLPPSLSSLQGSVSPTIGRFGDCRCRESCRRSGQRHCSGRNSKCGWRLTDHLDRAATNSFLVNSFSANIATVKNATVRQWAQGAWPPVPAKVRVGPAEELSTDGGRRPVVLWPGRNVARRGRQLDQLHRVRHRQHHDPGNGRWTHAQRRRFAGG